MDEELDRFVYMMAAEKVVNLVCCIENTMDWMQEYKVEPDDEVKKVLKPLIEQMNKWIK